METSFLWFGVFSGSFGVRSIVLCKCSGNVLIGCVCVCVCVYRVCKNNKSEWELPKRNDICGNITSRLV